MDNFNKRQEWEQIRNVLKNKYHNPNSLQDHNNAPGPAEAWQKYQQLTGKSKEEIINLLHKL